MAIEQNVIEVLLRLTGASNVSDALATVRKNAKSMGDTVDRVNKQIAVSAGLTRNELLNLGYQVQDIGVSIVSGQNPLVVLAQQGSQVASIWMASRATMAGSLRQLASGAAAAARPVGILGAGLAVLATAWQGLKTAMAESNAEKSMASLGESNRRFGDMLLEQTDAALRAGRISAERAREISSDIRSAFGDEGLAYGAKMPVGSGGLNAASPTLVADMLMATARELRSKLPSQLTQAALEAHRAAGMARVEAEKDIQDRLGQMSLDQLDRAYESGTIKIEGWLARRRQLATESHKREIEFVEAEQHDLRLRILSADADEKAKLATSAASLVERKRLAEIEFATELSRIAAEGVKERERLEEEAARKRKQDATDELRMKQQALQLDLAMANADWRRTDQERFAAQRNLINAGERDGTLTGPEAGLMRLQQGPDPRSYTEQFSAGIVQFQSQWGTFQQQLASTSLGALQTGIDATAEGLTRMIFLTRDWQSFLNQIPLMIGMQIVQAIIKMGLQWVATQVLMAVAGKSIQAAAAASTTPIALAQSAIWATPATLATIASYGGAAAAAPGFIAAAQGVTMAQSLAMFREGGYTGDGGLDDVAGLVHRREFVMPADVTAAVGPENLQGMVNAVRSPVTRGSTAASSATSAGSPGETFIFHDLDAALDAFMASPATEKRLLRMVNGRAVDMGIRRA